MKKDKMDHYECKICGSEMEKVDPQRLEYYCLNEECSEYTKEYDKNQLVFDSKIREYGK